MHQALALPWPKCARDCVCIDTPHLHEQRTEGNIDASGTAVVAQNTSAQMEQFDSSSTEPQIGLYVAVNTWCSILALNLSTQSYGIQPNESVIYLNETMKVQCIEQGGNRMDVLCTQTICSNSAQVEGSWDDVAPVKVALAVHIGQV